MFSQLTNPLIVLRDQPSVILYDIPAGKPDNSERRTGGLDTRKRIEQKEMRINACFHYGLNLIRGRVGKDPVPSLARARRFEKICLEYFKTAEEIYKQNEILFLLTSSCRRNMFDDYELNEQSSEREWAEKLLNPPKPEKAVQLTESQKTTLRDFLSHTECNNSVDYMGLLTQDLDISFLEKICDDLAFIAFVKANPQWSFMCLQNKMVEGFDLNPTRWLPEKSCSEFISVLRDQGPTFFACALGATFYVKDPSILSQKIAGKSIYYWPPGSVRRETGATHVIVVIGAHVLADGRERVYYIDPNDSSSPGTDRKIYTTSYATFKGTVSILRHFASTDTPKDCFGCYGYCGRFEKIPSLPVRV